VIIQASESIKVYARYILTCAFLCMCLLGACQGTQENVTRSSPSATATLPTAAPYQEADTGILDSSVELAGTTPAYAPTVGMATPTVMPNSAYRLTSMSVSGTPWWSVDSNTLFFSDDEQKSQTWRIDLRTHDIEPAPQVQSPYAKDFALLTTLVPSDVSPYAASVSPMDNKIIFYHEVSASDPPQKACDGEACWTIPANEIWLIDVNSEQLTQLEIEMELVASSLSFIWSADERRFLVAASWGVGPGPSGTLSFWIGDLATERVSPVAIGDEWSRCLSISPDSKLILYQLPTPDFDSMYLWNIDTQEEKFMPNFPCTSYLWLSDSRRVIYHEEEKGASAFWLYNVMTLEKRSIASSTTLPDIQSYSLAPDERSIALVPWSHQSSGIWIVEFDLPVDYP
jgi:hypothetical protein